MVLFPLWQVCESKMNITITVNHLPPLKNWRGIHVGFTSDQDALISESMMLISTTIKMLPLIVLSLRLPIVLSSNVPRSMKMFAKKGGKVETLPLSLALRHQSLACHSRFALKCEKGKRKRRRRQVHWVLFPKYDLLKAPDWSTSVDRRTSRSLVSYKPNWGAWTTCDLTSSRLMVRPYMYEEKGGLGINRPEPRTTLSCNK